MNIQLRFKKILIFLATPFAIKLVLMLMISIAGGLMMSAAITDSATSDELPHIVAGYTSLITLDSRMNPEHPPLLKILSTLPLLILKPQVSLADPNWEMGREGEWGLGRTFLYESGNTPEEIIFIARLFPIFLTLLLALLVFTVAQKLYGPRWALFPTALFAFSPSILAHGHYVATDIAAAFGILIALVALLREWEAPSRKSLVVAGIAFGIAQLMKFSTILLVPFFFLLAFSWAICVYFSNRTPLPSDKFRLCLSEYVKKMSSVLWILIIGYAGIVYPTYALLTSQYPIAKQTSDTRILLKSFEGGETRMGHMCTPLRCLADGTIFLSQFPVTRPIAEYGLGLLMVSQRISGGNTNYFFGKVSNTGTGAYFPALFLLKETLPTLLFLLMALGLGFRSIGRFFRTRNQHIIQKTAEYCTRNFTQFSFMLFILLYVFISLQSPLHIGFRHLIPILPPLYLLMTSPLQKWACTKHRWLKHAFIGLVLLWFFSETIRATPYYLSYFNQIGGGVSEGYTFVTDSNYDWGQDFLRFRDWSNEHLHGEKIAVDYFGGSSPSYYLPNQAVGWASSMGDPRSKQIHWLAVSVGTLETAFAKADYSYERRPEDEYSWLKKIRFQKNTMGSIPEPDFRIGTTIFIYRLPESFEYAK